MPNTILKPAKQSNITSLTRLEKCHSPFFSLCIFLYSIRRKNVHEGEYMTNFHLYASNPFKTACLLLFSHEEGCCGDSVYVCAFRSSRLYDMGSESRIQSGRQRLSEEREITVRNTSVGFRHTVAWCYVCWVCI